MLGGPEASGGVRTANAVEDRVGPAWRRFALLYFTLLVVGIGIVFAFTGPVYGPYWALVERLKGPELQKQFGFVAERRAIRSGWSSLVIVEVRPGGRFAVAGVRAGDVVTCLYHGPADFWGGLQAVEKGHEVSISVLPLAEADRGCAGARRIRLTP